MTSSENDLKDINSSLSSLKSIEDNDKKIYSKNDLNNHLNEIKSVLRDKERDLSLAAEIGQQLLEANTVLKKAYEELFIQNQDAQKQLHRYEQLTEVRSGRSSPVQSCSSPLSPRYTSMRSRTNSPTPARRLSRNFSLPPSVRLDGTAPSSPSSSLAKSNDSFDEMEENYIENEKNPKSPRSPRSPSNPLKEKYREKIKFLETSINNLERHNEELKVLLDKKKEEVKDIQIQNSKLLLIKDGEVYDLKQELESLMIKTKKLEMEKKNLTKENQRQASELDRIETIDQAYIQDLLSKINRLDGSLKRMENTKEELEKNIENIMVEKMEYQDKCKTLDKKLQDYYYYKHIHDTQAQHIHELNQTIEQQRMQIQNLDFQLYNLSMTPEADKYDIKFSEKYLLENPESIESLEKSNNSLNTKSSTSMSYINEPYDYDSDTIVITAKRRISSSNVSNIRSTQSSQESVDPLLTLSNTNLGKKTLYSELEGTDWYYKLDNNNYDIEGRNPPSTNQLAQSASDSVLFKRDDPLNSYSHQPYPKKYPSTSSTISVSNNSRALALINKASQTFKNKKIEEMIKPQIENDVNSYERLINTIESELKTSEEIQTNTNDDGEKEEDKTLLNSEKEEEEEKNKKGKEKESSLKSKDKTEVNSNMMSSTSDNIEESSKITNLADKKDARVDDTTLKNNQSTPNISNSNKSNSSNTYTYRTNLNYQNLSNSKTLALIKHSNIPLFDYKKLSQMIEKDKTLNPQKMKTSASEGSIPSRPTKPQNPLLQNHIRKMSFDSILKAFELSRLQSSRLLTDGKNTSNSRIRRNNNNNSSGSNLTSSIYNTAINNNKNGTSINESKINNGMSILDAMMRLSSPPSQESVSIQEIDDNDEANLTFNNNTIPTNNTTDTMNPMNTNFISSTTPFYMAKNSSVAQSMTAPMNANIQNQTFSHLIKNFHLASPVTPLIANINLNNTIREEEAAIGTSSSIATSNTSTPKPKSKKASTKTSTGESSKSVFSIINKPLFNTTRRLSFSFNKQQEKEDVPLTQEPNSTTDPSSSSSIPHHYPGSHVLSMIKEKYQQNHSQDSKEENLKEEGEEGRSMDTNESSSSSSTSLVPTNAMMNNQAMIDQYRDTLNHYSNSGSAILQVLIDSWLRFLNGFVGYGSDINYDINTMNYDEPSSSVATSASNLYTQDSNSRTTLSDEIFDPTDVMSNLPSIDPTSTATTSLASSSPNNSKALTPYNK